MKSPEQLKQLYENDLKPQLAGLEQQRKNIKRLWTLAFVIGIFTLFIAPKFSWNDILMMVINILGILATVALLGIGVVKFFSYRNAFKKQVVSKVVHLINPHYFYNADKHISTEIFNESGLSIKSSDRCFGDDYISGSIDKTDFEFSEIKAANKQTTTENGKTSTSWKPVFEGLFFHADFNKHIDGTTYVLPDTTEKLFGKLAQNFQKLSSRGELVNLENPQFEKEYKVYSTDQQHARYILTPSMMEAMVNIKKQFKRKIQFSFKGERVYCGIEYKQGLFEPRIRKTGVNYNDIEEMYYLFGLIETIIVEMNLNTRIWTKE